MARLSILAYLEESLQDLLGRVSPVLVEQVDVLDAPLGEASPVVAPLVESDHTGHTQIAEYGYIVLGKQRPFPGFHLSPASIGGVTYSNR